MKVIVKPITNFIVREAKSFPDMLDDLKEYDPDIAAHLIAKPTLMSKTPLAVVLAMAIAWVSTRLGLGWDDGVCQIVAGVAVLVVGYVMRARQTQPTAGLFTVPKTPMTTETKAPPTVTGGGASV